MQVQSIEARELLDSRGFPTLEIELTSARGAVGRAMVPSGASTGSLEAHELRDQDPQRYLGKGVRGCLRVIQEVLAPALCQKSFENQFAWDARLIELDATPQKSRLGSNTLLGCSLAFLKAQAEEAKEPLFLWVHHLSKFGEMRLPTPLMNVFNGGRHATNGLDIQEWMIVPAGFDTFSESLQAGVEIFHALKKVLVQNNLSTGVGDEGGFAPSLRGDRPHRRVLELLCEAIQKAGYVLGKHIFLALDVAASEFWREDGAYYQFEGKKYASEDLIALYEEWVRDFPILSIEDGLGEKDELGWKQMTDRLGDRCHLIGDDLFVTQPGPFKRGIEQGLANAILIKLNQVGTVSETLETQSLARASQYLAVPSHRSGETEDTWLADWAVGTGSFGIKTGSL